MAQDAPKRRFLSLIFLVSCISKSLLLRDITYAKKPVFVVSSARDWKDGNFTYNPAKNIDLLQRVTLKSVDFRVKPLQF